MLGEKTSYKALTCCGLIIAGFFLGIDQENALGKYLNFPEAKHPFLVNLAEPESNSDVYIPKI
jgi:hypothetical protein